MLPEQEAARAGDDPADEPGGAEVPVPDPQLARLDGLEHARQQRPLLGVAVLAREHVDRQPPLGVEDHHRQPGQGRRARGPQRLEPVVTGLQDVAVEDRLKRVEQQRTPPSPQP